MAFDLIYYFFHADDDDDDKMHALPVGDAALANEFARVAANGERISCDDIVD